MLMTDDRVSLYGSNWGSELDESLSFHNGNKPPLGFGEASVET